MDKNYSDFGRKFSSHSGIYELMEDLGRALASADPGLVMMGGGNPAHIPAVESVWRERMEQILAQPGALEQMLGDYDTPRGCPEFLETLADYFNRTLGWEITAENIAVTTGSQSASFLLFNLFAGPAVGSARTILFPIVPEYIGYADTGIASDMFSAWKPRIEMHPEHRFKYRIDFQKIGPEVGALCLSRPTNPSANLVTDEELEHLAALAQERGIPLIVDNAYGQPFPGVVFRPVKQVWNDAVIHCFSLSKLGLPATRTGIVVAAPEIIRRLSMMNASLVLSNCGVGQTIVQPLLETGRIDELCNQSIRPFYQERSRRALAAIGERFGEELDYHVHESEGAFFLWLWFRGLPITDRELYRRLKERSVLVVPGSYFFPGLREPWQHANECLRLSYCAKEEHLLRGIDILAEEVARAYKASHHNV